MFKLIAVTDQASCPENFWTQLQLLAASEIDALIFRAKELPPQEYYRQGPPAAKKNPTRKSIGRPHRSRKSAGHISCR